MTLKEKLIMMDEIKARNDKRVKAWMLGKVVDKCQTS